MVSRRRVQAAHFAVCVSGIGRRSLKILSDARDAFGLRIVTEAVDEAALDLVEKYADVIQIGTRNMQNFSLLRRAGQARKPVLLKRAGCLRRSKSFCSRRNTSCPKAIIR